MNVEYSWDCASDRYLLATSTFTPLYGRLCNVLGRRGANQTAVLFAALGTAACGFSTNMETLIAARFVSHLRSVVRLCLTGTSIACRHWRGWYLHYSNVIKHSFLISYSPLTRPPSFSIITSDMYSLRVWLLARQLLLMLICSLDPIVTRSHSRRCSGV